MRSSVSNTGDGRAGGTLVALFGRRRMLAGRAPSRGAAQPAFPPLWDEPKDYERSLQRQLGQIDARIAHGPFKASWQSLERLSRTRLVS